MLANFCRKKKLGLGTSSAFHIFILKLHRGKWVDIEEQWNYCSRTPFGNVEQKRFFFLVILLTQIHVLHFRKVNRIYIANSYWKTSLGITNSLSIYWQIHKRESSFSIEVNHLKFPLQGSANCDLFIWFWQTWERHTHQIYSCLSIAKKI